MPISKEMTITIEPFQKRFQTAVEELVLPIQQLEFGVSITREEQPDLIDIGGTFLKGSGNFWVACCGEEVVGCVGVVDFGQGRVALKKMFVSREYRGKTGVAAALFSSARAWCLEHGVVEIWLGTISQMKAAHRFYEKNGFVEVSASELPDGFPLVTVDNKFYCLTLS